MKISKFFVFVSILFVIALVVYLTTTPRGNEIPLTGIVTGTDVIVSPQLAGRMVRLTVDEGSEVHKGDLIAELDPAEYITARNSAEANVHMLESKVPLPRIREAGPTTRPTPRCVKRKPR